jgi:hypothetical protein
MHQLSECTKEVWKRTGHRANLCEVFALFLSILRFFIRQDVTRPGDGGYSEATGISCGFSAGGALQIMKDLARDFRR